MSRIRYATARSIDNPPETLKFADAFLDSPESRSQAGVPVETGITKCLFRQGSTFYLGDSISRESGVDSAQLPSRLNRSQARGCRVKQPQAEVRKLERSPYIDGNRCSVLADGHRCASENRFAGPISGIGRVLPANVFSWPIGDGTVHGTGSRTDCSATAGR